MPKSEFIQRSIGIPKRYQGKTFASFMGYEDVKKRIAGALERQDSILLLGPAGIGKSHLAVAAVYEWLSQNLDWLNIETGNIDWQRIGGAPIFVPSVELFLQLRASFSGDTPEFSVLKPYLRSSFLVIDDLGAEKISDWTRMEIYEIVDKRYREMKPTIITSNLTLEKMSEQLDDRIISRFHEMGIIIQLEGKDYRVEHYV